MQRIGFGKRLLAAIIDGVIVGVGGSIAGSLFGGLVGSTMGQTGMESQASIMAGVAAGMIFFVLIACAYGLIEGFTGASPGKMILKIIIRNADGSQAETSTLLFRYALKNSSSIVSLVGFITGLAFLSWISNLLALAVLIGCFFVLAAARQAFHDMIAKTAVYPKG